MVGQGMAVQVVHEKSKPAVCRAPAEDLHHTRIVKMMTEQGRENDIRLVFEDRPAIIGTDPYRTRKVGVSFLRVADTCRLDVDARGPEPDAFFFRPPVDRPEVVAAAAADLAYMQFPH